MICPVCGRKGNPMGADYCRACLFDLAAVDRLMPSDRVEESLMRDPVAALRPPAPVTVPRTAPVATIVFRMVADRAGAVLVVEDSGLLAGIVTERDLLLKVAGQSDPEPIVAATLMTPRPETVTATDPLAVVLGKMAAGGYRHLPVVEAGAPVGVVSVRDVLRHVVRLCEPTR